MQRWHWLALHFFGLFGQAFARMLRRINLGTFSAGCAALHVPFF
jgi:hypothetical protein